MTTALIVLVSVAISLSMFFYRMLRVELAQMRQEAKGTTKDAEERLRLEIKAVEGRLEQKIGDAKERLEKTSKERHEQVMAALEKWPVREFENRITVVEQAQGQPPEQGWGRVQARARTQAAE